MPKPSPAETYASKEVSEWLFDRDGYCPFTRVRLEGVIRKSFADGAASAMGTGSLTPLQRKAIVSVLNERIAGGQDDLRDALGMTNREAADMMRILNRVVEKLA